MRIICNSSIQITRPAASPVEYLNLGNHLYLAFELDCAFVFVGVDPDWALGTKRTYHNSKLNKFIGAQLRVCAPSDSKGNFRCREMSSTCTKLDTVPN